MDDMQSTATIRQRGQLTLPDEIRDKISWLSPGSAVIITTSSKNEIKIIPYQRFNKKEIDWRIIWDQIKLVRTFKGKRGNLSNFIVEDRYRH